MTQEQIYQLFKQGYNQANWKQFLGETFSKSRLLAKPEILSDIDSNVASKALKLGYIFLDEKGVERQIAVYEVELAKGIILERNRVGLRKLLRKYWKDIDAAFIVYHSTDASTDSARGKWRFTFVSELTGYDADGKFIKIKTEPKRYTYVLGEGESTRTAAERFAIIAEKANKATLDDVKDAFSVEKLSKAFFDEYRNHYNLFCQFMIKKPGIKASIFDGDEKAIRDFCKKLLGRIVFLYFVQKKGWLGVPPSGNWGQGDFDFLNKLFKQQKNPELFYSETLTKLFFDTLNTKRKDDIIELVKGQACRIPFLNGGLFEEDETKQRNIIFSASLFENLFEFFNKYNFTIFEDDPNDHTVAVDPEMLGHIFENLLEDNKDKGAFYTPKEIVHYLCQESLIEYLSTWFENKGYEVTGYIGFDNAHQAQLISHNDDRKEQMMLETAPQTKGKQIEHLLIVKLLKKKLDEQDNELVKQHAAEFNSALDNVKICDPAIGSGAFPMGMLQEIFTAKQTIWYFEHGNLTHFPASDVKLKIIQNSIYGVDIEKGAVDIARLRFWLSLVVDEETPKALPNLDFKIVVGNSLANKLADDIIDIDWSLDETQHGFFGADLAKRKDELLKKISAEQKEFFNPDSDKKKLAADIRNLKIDLLINQLELMITTKGIELKPNGTGKKLAEQTELYLQTIGWKNSINQLKKLKEQTEKPLLFFDWKLDFPEVLNEWVNTIAGFDIVIGNPPYIQLQKAFDSKNKFADLYKNLNYETFDRMGDIYCLFYEKGIRLLKTNGILAYITSNKWMRSGYGEKLRTFFTKYNPQVLIDLGPNVFENATVDTNILIIQKSKNKNKTQAVSLNEKNKDSIDFSKALENNGVLLKNLSKDAWFIGSDAEQRLKEKIERRGKPLKDWDMNIYYGIKTGLNEAFIIDTDKRNEILSNCKDEDERKRTEAIIKPILRGRDIKRYYYEWAELWVIIIPASWTNKNRGIENSTNFIEKTFPAMMEYLKPFESKAQKRDDQGDYWWELRACAYYPEFEKEKVIYPNMTKYLPFVYDDSKKFTNQKCFILTSSTISLKYLVAYLNSKISSKWIRENCPELQGGTRELSWIIFQNIPIPPITHANQPIVNQIEELVDKILTAKKQSKAANTSQWEQEIDRLVYKLYELTYEEVKLIDPEFTLRKKEYESIGFKEQS